MPRRTTVMNTPTITKVMITKVTTTSMVRF
jgi:hypothetical protein